MDAAERARLVEGHLDLAKKAAALIFPRVREHVGFDDLVALGNIGLVEAANHFDPDRGTAFATFAWYRVQGAILDAMRREAALPRAVWRKLVALRASIEWLEHRAEREAGAVARGARPATGADALAEAKAALSAIRTMYVTSLDRVRETGEVDAPSTAPTPDDQLERTRLARAIAAAFDRLTDRERTLVEKHYVEGKNLLEAGAEMGFSKSWACRLHAQAVEKIRVAVDAALDERRPRARGP